MANTLLVLGNGFDLNCGLESSFSQYMNSQYYKPFLDRIHRAYNYVLNCLIGYGTRALDERPYNMILEDKELSFWDFYFAIPHLSKVADIRLWHDFETKLFELVNSGKNRRGEFQSILTMSWDKSDINRLSAPDHICFTVQRIILNDYMSCRKMDKGDHVLVLLNDLKHFERKFGAYISLQQKDNREYNKRAVSLIDELLGKDSSGIRHTLSYINTFNYTNIKEVGFKNRTRTDYAVWHVNGDTTNPIFGIDISEQEPADSKWYSFTKTYRRLELEGNDEYYPTSKKNNRVVVYGHSLTKQDYSFFYALFNRLNLGDEHRLQNGTSIRFAYSAYEGKTADEARHDTIESVLRLLQGYSRDILDEKTFHLMDILHCNGTVEFVEIPPIVIL